MLSEISYQHICDNYWYGMYGDFNIILMKDCGFVNVTKLCKDGGKDLCDWSRNKSSKELLQALSSKQSSSEVSEIMHQEQRNLSTMELDYKRRILRLPSSVYKHVQTTNDSKEQKLISGTYCHPLLIPHIGCWVSPSFALKVSDIVNNYSIAEFKSKLEETRMALYYTQQDLVSTQDTLSITQQRLDSQQFENHTLGKLLDDKNEIIKLKHDAIEVKHETIEELKENITEKETQHRKWSSTHSFTLLKTNDAEAVLPYYVIRCLRGKVSSAINKLHLKHPKAQIVWQQYLIPNVVNLYSRLKAGKSVHTHHNYCIPSHSEEQFINTLNDLAGKDKTRWIYANFNK